MLKNDEIARATDENKIECESSQRTKKLRIIAYEMDKYERFDVLDE